jgi:hypothetical protein
MSEEVKPTKPENKIRSWNEICEEISELAYSLQQELQEAVDKEEEVPPAETFMTVREFKEFLKEFDDDQRMRFHTQFSTDLCLLSAYVGDNKEFVEVDIGREEEGE